jgi:hypothetical protein
MSSSVKAREYALGKIPKILKDAKLIEGESLDTDQVKKSNDTLFWHKQLPNEAAAEKPTFITWNLISTDAIGRADNNVAVRIIYVAIDLFTKKPERDAKITRILGDIEEAMADEGWSFEQVAASTYDKETQLTDISYSATKKVQEV